jgi:hypothetical protein
MKTLINKIISHKTKLQNQSVRYQTASGLLLFIASFGSQAADIAVLNNNMQVSITVNGEIKPGDGDRFSLIAKDIKKATVILNSEGGDLVSGIQIGTIIREKGYATLVNPKNTCASSCGLIWFSGMPRYLSNEVNIGFHSAYTIENGKTLETGVGNAIVGAYLTRLGATYETIIYFTEASPDEINWLTPIAARKLNISFSDPNSGKKVTQNEKYQIATEGSAFKGIEKNAFLISNNYFEMMMKDYASSRYFLLSILGNDIITNDEFRTKNEIVSTRISQFHKWKSRAFEIIPETIKINCVDIRSCEVSGNFTWVGITTNYEYGIGDFKFDIDFTQGKPKIFGDSVNFN